MNDKFNEQTVTTDGGYEEIKNGLKSKYSKMIFARIDELRQSALKKLFGAMDEGIISLIYENERLKKLCDEDKKTFYEGSDYKDAQNKLVELKNKLSLCKDDIEKEEINKQLSKALDRISTLNVTINNRLKKYTDKMHVNASAITGAIASDEGEFGEVKKNFIESVDEILQEGIASYNDELKSVNETFGVEQSSDPDLPFDENEVRIEIDMLPPSVKDLGEDIIRPENGNSAEKKENKVFINIENDSTIKN